MSNNAIKEILKNNFGFDEFRKPQDAIIDSILGGHDTLAIMPTGGGKSLCYQLPALALENAVTLVVSPLIALMKDQVDALTAKGIPAVMINSSQSLQEQMDAMNMMRFGRVKLAYIAPERFRAKSFVTALRGVNVKLFAIDEAHCISQWGHDFRPDYMRLGEALQILGNPVCAAFTATATPEVKADILAQLKMRTPNVFVSGFARSNLSFNVLTVEKKIQKYMRIAELIEKYKTGIIYCSTRKSAETLSSELSDDGIDHVLYHGGMTPNDRDYAQELFVGKKKSIAVATNAFGMGIDRSDIRFVCHYELTGSIEAYYQEAGRAGRDGLPAYCEMLFMYADKRIQEFFIEGANPTAAFIRNVYRVIRENVDNSYETTISIENITEAVADIERFENNGYSKRNSAKSFGRQRFGSSPQSSKGGNSMSVSSAISVLRRLGYIDRFDIPGVRTRGTRLINPDIDEQELAIPTEELEQKKSRDMSKLRDVLRFAYSKDCRQRWILNYFGEISSVPCATCDNCKKGDVRVLELPTSDEIDIVKKALSCVARMSRRIGYSEWEPRFGKNLVQKCLMGSKEERILNAHLDELSTYAILKEFGSKFVANLLDTLIDANLLEIIDGEFPLLGITSKGADVMLGIQACPPMEFPKIAIPSKTTTSLSPVISSSTKKQTHKVKNGIDEDDILGENDFEIYDQLVIIRDNLRKHLRNMPAYKIFPNTVLKHLAVQRPKTTEQAMEIKGIGELKAKKYLPPFLEFLNSSQITDE